MGYIKFDKNQLINLEYSLHRELVRSNRAGSFSSTTIVGCNTRKYHGLLICPQPQLDDEAHVLLSKVDETVIQREAEFNIGINKYHNTYNPKGHKYIRDFSAEIIPKITFRVGGVILTKEMMLVKHEERILIKYTLVEAKSPTRLRIKPFLAFRNRHVLSKQNIDLNTKYENIPNGIKVKMYEGYSYLYMQISKNGGEYVHVPDWYRDIEYMQEKNRGYEFNEDLYVPGFFEIDIKRGESIIFSAGTKEVKPLGLSRSFNKELSERVPRNNFKNCLENSAEQFISKRDNELSIITGYPWYDSIGRFTFIALPGLTLSINKPDEFTEAFDTMISRMNGPLFPETGKGNKTTYNSVDTALWFIWSLQQYVNHSKNKKETWKKYKKVIKLILDSYKNCNLQNIRMHDNGLLYSLKEAAGHTWMNCQTDGVCVTPRYGYVVEVNSLWYNAVCFAIELAKSANDKDFIKTWDSIVNRIPQSFMNVFWINDKGYLADFVADGIQNYDIRPNQVIAASLQYRPINDLTCKTIIEFCYKQLHTAKGLRTLSPQDPKYKGICKGNHIQRNCSMHQGTVWPWLSEHFAQALFNIYKESAIKQLEKIYDDFESAINERGVGTMSEIHEGDPPHNSCGAISFAPSVAALLRISNMIEHIKKTKKKNIKKK